MHPLHVAGTGFRSDDRKDAVICCWCFHFVVSYSVIVVMLSQTFHWWIRFQMKWDDHDMSLRITKKKKKEDTQHTKTHVN